ncbi:MAG: ABC transporter permease subunit [Lachnospiraceae bacterium]|nr:ABC transporter permease subunit [Lachnospiraceae bacterium]MBQ3967547.1 ABC transporter permease subunit [Lachnospiraceae bacterium]
MTAIFKRELRSYFTNMIGYVIVAALSFLLGLFFCIYNIRNGYPYFGYAVSGVVPYLMVVMPILTMKCFSDERKSKTDQLLLTSPATISQIVMGKFMSMVTVFAVPVIIACVYPLFLGAKAHSFAIDYSCIFAFFLLGCAYIAIGMFISSLTESQIISAVVTFIVFFIFYLMSMVTGFIPSASYVNAAGFTVAALIFAVVVRNVTSNLVAALITFVCLAGGIWILFAVKADIYYGSLAKVLSAVSFSDGISYFVSGIFDVKAVIMFVSFIILFVFLTTQSIQKRRWN